MIIQIAGSCSSQKEISDNDVIKAYDLRMQGKVDEALTLLDSILANDSTNAMAYYELSRVKLYMLTGGGDVSIDDILASVDKATLYDPENVIYAYAKATDNFLNAYISMMKNQDDVADAVEKTCQAFQHVLELKSDYPEAMLYLVEIYGLLPPEMGGDSIKAVYYVELLEETDDYYAAKAMLDMNEVDEVTFWKEYLSSHGTTADVLKEIGIAYLYQEDPEQAEDYFNQAMLLDSTQNILLLDLARYYMYQVMQNRELADSLLPISADYTEQYLAGEPAPVIPLQAYATGMLVKTKMFTGHKEEAEKLMEKAKSLDPYFSRASGIPSQSLFEPPDIINHHFGSFFRPF